MVFLQFSSTFQHSHTLIRTVNGKLRDFSHLELTGKAIMDNVKIQDKDTRLMLKVKNGDIAAFSKLFIIYRPIVIDYLSKIGKFDGWTEDIVQEVFIRIWINRRSFRADSAVKTYIFGIARNVVREYSRKFLRKSSKYQKTRTNPNICNCLSEPEAAVFCAELIRYIERSKLKLTEKQQQALELLQKQDFSNALAAQQAGCSNVTFRQRLYEARNQIEKLIKEFEKPK